MSVKPAIGRTSKLAVRSTSLGVSEGLPPVRGHGWILHSGISTVDNRSRELVVWAPSRGTDSSQMRDRLRRRAYLGTNDLSRAAYTLPSAVGVRSCLDRARIDSVKLSWALVIGAATAIAEPLGSSWPGTAASGRSGIPAVGR